MQNPQQHSPSPADSDCADEMNQQASRITELETRVLFLEDTIEQLNSELTSLNSDFLMARQAMQLMNKRIEQLLKLDSQGQGGDEPPPPHY